MSVAVDTDSDVASKVQFDREFTTTGEANEPSTVDACHCVMTLPICAFSC